MPEKILGMSIIINNREWVSYSAKTSYGETEREKWRLLIVLLIKNGYVIIAVWCRGGCNKTGGWKGATISAKLTALDFLWMIYCLKSIKFSYLSCGYIDIDRWHDDIKDRLLCYLVLSSNDT
jgi:hypothetical protein